MKAYVTKWALTKGIIEVDNPEFYENYPAFARKTPLFTAGM